MRWIIVSHHIWVRIGVFNFDKSSSTCKESFYPRWRGKTKVWRSNLGTVWVYELALMLTSCHDDISVNLDFTMHTYLSATTLPKKKRILNLRIKFFNFLRISVSQRRPVPPKMYYDRNVTTLLEIQTYQTLPRDFGSVEVSPFLYFWNAESCHVSTKGLLGGSSPKI